MSYKFKPDDLVTWTFYTGKSYLGSAFRKASTGTKRYGELNHPREKYAAVIKVSAVTSQLVTELYCEIK